MDINFDILMHHLPCSYLHIDVIDIIKESDDTVQGRVRMERFDEAGNPISEKPHPEKEVTPPPDYCGSCYSLKPGCCNTCKDVRRAFKEKHRPLPPIATIEQCTREGYTDWLKSMVNESCRVHGSLSVHLHPGTFHVAPGDAQEAGSGHADAYEKLGVDIGMLNLSHTINHFSLGLPQRNGHYPLDGTKQIQAREGRLKMYYYVRAVPVGSGAKYFSIGVSSYQNYRGNLSTKFPGIFFAYDISPISVVEEYERSIMEFFVEVSAILGGVFAIATFIDAIAFRCFSGMVSLPKTE
jgi:hypothetical protein